ncbi:MAG: hypothetical protein ACKODX_15165 [Gemmata sp.]
MTRMSRELTLTLLGAGLLTATYFAWPDEDYSKEADKQAEKRVGGRPRSSGGGTFIFIGHYAGGGGSSVRGGSPAMGSSVSRGGFGSVGGRVGGGIGG